MKILSLIFLFFFYPLSLVGSHREDRTRITILNPKKHLLLYKGDDPDILASVYSFRAHAFFAKRVFLFSPETKVLVSGKTYDTLVLLGEFSSEELSWVQANVKIQDKVLFYAPREEGFREIFQKKELHLQFSLISLQTGSYYYRSSLHPLGRGDQEGARYLNESFSPELISDEAAAVALYWRLRNFSEKAFWEIVLSDGRDMEGLLEEIAPAVEQEKRRRVVVHKQGAFYKQAGLTFHWLEASYGTTLLAKEVFTKTESQFILFRLGAVDPENETARYQIRTSFKGKLEPSTIATRLIKIFYEEELSPGVQLKLKKDSADFTLSVSTSDIIKALRQVCEDLASSASF